MTDEPGQPGQPPPPDDENRRRFFRLFAGDVMSSVGTVLGAAQVLQRESAAAARDLLGDSAAIDFLGGPAVAVSPVAELPVEVSALGVGYRTPLRWDDDSCRVVDQRRLPDVLAELTIEGAADGVAAIRDGAVVGGAIQAQLASVTLALTAARVMEHRPFARRATIRGAANALKNARPGSAAVRAAVQRMLAVEERLGIEAPGEVLDAAMRAEAEAVLREASDAHGTLVGLAMAALPPAMSDADDPDPAPPLRVLTNGSTGAMSGGQLGSALSAIMAVHHSGRPIHAIVAETRPGFEGSRIAAWELREAGVPHVVVTDGAAPGMIATGEVDAILVGADRVLADGDVIAVAGTYPLALAASAAGIPFIVCVPSIAVDTEPDTAPLVLEERPSGEVISAAGTRVTPEGTPTRNPVQDRTPAALVTALVSEPRLPVAEVLGPASTPEGTDSAPETTTTAPEAVG